MTLRLKILVAVAVTFVAMAAFTSLVTNQVLLNSFRTLEEQQVKTNVTRVLHSLQEMLSSIEATGADWGAWNDTRDFVLGTNPTYAEDNLGDASIISLNLDFMVFFDSQERVVHAKGVNAEAGTDEAVSPLMIDALRRIPGLLQHKDTSESHAGFLNVEDKPIAVVSWPISSNDRDESKVGSLVIGRRLTDSRMRDLENRTQLSVSFAPHRHKEIGRTHAHIPSLLSAMDAIEVFPQGDDEIDGTAIVVGLQPEQDFVLTIRMPRAILKQGLSSIRYFRSVLAIVGIAVLLVLLLAIEQAVLRPVTELIDSVAHVSRAQDLSMRLPARNADELGKLADAVNQMLYALERAVEAQRRAEDQAQQAQRMESLNAMAGNIAHNFNNLLHIVLGHHELLLEDMQVSDEVRVQIKEADKAARRAAELSTLMLAYVGQSRRPRKPVNLSRLAEAAADAQNGACPERITITRRLAADIPEISGDAGQIEQMLSNLFSNAVEAMGKGEGDISIETGVMACSPERLRQSVLFEGQVPGDYAYLEVRDTGVGMDEETRQKAFEPYFSTKFVGRGLGLAAVLGITRSHRGTILLHSEPGRGTSVRVLFPLSQASENP